MLPFKKILCPTDFSEPSYEALKTATELALHFSAQIILVHVVPPLHVIPPADTAATFNPLYVKEMEDAGKQGLAKLAQEQIPDKVERKLTVIQGNPPDEIVRVASEEKADIIVIATHGTRGFQRFIFGSVAEKVVRISACPVMTIRAPKEQS